MHGVTALTFLRPFPAAPEGTCVSRCGVYVEEGGPVLILAGTGLDVEDDDQNSFFMQVLLKLP